MTISRSVMVVSGIMKPVHLFKDSLNSGLIKDGGLEGLTGSRWVCQGIWTLMVQLALSSMCDRICVHHRRQNGVF